LGKGSRPSQHPRENIPRQRRSLAKLLEIRRQTVVDGTWTREVPAPAA
jgi:hypothetical protein